MTPPSKQPPHAWPRAFSLIELLVVTTIVSVMIALLLPSLSRAREVARISLCKSRLHHIGVAEMSYAADNRAYYIMNYIPSLGNTAAYSYNFILLYDYTYNGAPIPKAYATWDQYLSGSGRGMHCPEYFDTNPPTGWGTLIWNGNATGPPPVTTVVPYYYSIRYQIWAGNRSAFNGLPNVYRGQGNREVIPVRTDDKRRKMFHSSTTTQLSLATTDAPLANCVWSLSTTPGQPHEWSHSMKGMNSLQTDGSVKWKAYPGAPVIDYSGDPDVIKFAHNYNSAGPYTGTPFWNAGY